MKLNNRKELVNGLIPSGDMCQYSDVCRFIHCKAHNKTLLENYSCGLARAFEYMNDSELEDLHEEISLENVTVKK